MSLISQKIVAERSGLCLGVVSSFKFHSQGVILVCFLFVSLDRSAFSVYLFVNLAFSV